MGPQFNVFGNLSKMKMSEVRLYEDGTPEEGITSFFSNPEFPSHIAGIDSNQFYKCCGKKMRFGATTYEEFNEFRDHLACIAGFQHGEALWKSGQPAFFLELIHFSNCEGTIGPIISKKLYLDFKDNYHNAQRYFLTLSNGHKFWMHYQNWTKALSVARQSGAILLT